MASKTLDIVIRAVDQASTKLGKIDNALKAQGTSLANVSKQFKIAGTAMTAFGTLIVGNAIKTAVSFNKSMSNINTLFDDNGESVAELKKGIKDLLKTVPKNSEELGASAYAIVSAGITDTSDALKILEASAKLSVVGLGSVEDATTLMVLAQNNFKNSTLSAEEKANVLFKTVRNGITTVAEMSQSFGLLAPLFETVGGSLEEMSAATAALTQVNKSASISQNSLKAGLVSMSKPTKEATELIEKLVGNDGTFADLVKKSGGVVAAWGAMQKATEGNTEQFAKAMGSGEALTAIISLLGSQSDSFTSSMDSMTDGTNVLSEAYKKQTKEMWAQWEVLKNNLNVEMIELGNKILPMLIPLIKKFSDALGDTNVNTTKLVLAITLLGGPMLLLIGFLPSIINGIGLLATGLNTLRTAIIMNITTLGWLKTALLALPLALVITIALIGATKILGTLKKLKKEINDQTKSETDLFDTRIAQIKKYKKLKESEDADIKKYAQAQLDYTRDMVLAQDQGLQVDLKAGRDKINSIKNELEEKGKLVEVQELLTGKIIETNEIPPPPPIPPIVPESVNKLSDTWDKYEDKVLEVNDNISNSLSDVSKQIKNLQSEMESLVVGNVKENVSINQEFGEEYVKQEEKVADLKTQLGKETDAFKRQTLKDELAFEQGELDRFGTIVIAHENEVNEARRRNSLSDIARAVEDLNKKRTLVNEEFELKANKIAQELVAEDNKYKKLAELQEVARKAAEKFDAQREIQTIESINRQIEAYNDLAKAIANAQQGRLSGYSGILGSTQEKATQTIPIVNLTINGDVSGEDLITKVKNGIIGDLGLSNNLG